MLAMLILDAKEVGSSLIIEPLPPGTMVAADYFGETGGINPPPNAGADREGPTHLAPDGFCDGVLCSICGLRTSSCFLRRQEMPTLESIRSQCYFADKPVEQMDNKHKRFLLYWWWAVNIFAIRGKGMRSELPACIVRRIREKYPNPKDEPYTGFKPWPTMHSALWKTT